MVQYQITEGSIKTCVSGQARTNADLGFDPVLQVRDFKLIGGGQTGVRYRVSLTDGVDTAMGIITSGVAHLVQENAIVENSIIRVTSFNMNDMNGALYVSLSSVLYLDSFACLWSLIPRMKLPLTTTLRPLPTLTDATKQDDDHCGS